MIAAKEWGATTKKVDPGTAPTVLFRGLASLIRKLTNGKDYASRTRRPWAGALMPRDPRPFITVHDGMPDHPKIEGLSDAAFRLLVSTWAWCNRNRTDGEVKQASWAKRGTAKARKELLDVGLAESIVGGVMMHDYLDHQRSAAEIDELSRRRSEAGKKGGKAKASAMANAKQVPKQTDGKTEAEKEVTTYSTTSTGSRNVPTGSVAQIVKLYVETARNAGIPTPEEAQGRVSRTARSLLAQDFPIADVQEAARNAAITGWTDLVTQLQRDAARAKPSSAVSRLSTADARFADAANLADELEAKELRAIS